MVTTIGLPLVAAIILLPNLELPIYDFVLFHPLKYPIGEYKDLAVNGINPTDHYFYVGKYKLHVLLYKMPKAKYVFLLSHGNGGNMTHRKDIVNLLLKTNNSVFAYDYEGYGKSEGDPTEHAICADALAAFNYVTKELQWSAHNVILFGESLGTVATGHLFRQVQCAAVVLQCPLYSLCRRGREIMPFLSIYPDWLWPMGGLDNGVIFAGKHPPLLIIAGTKDPMIPVSHADSLFSVASEPKMYARIQGAGHTGDPALMNSSLYIKSLTKLLMSLNARETLQ
jgi:pimeloyl-ACP methyl ester carboxylesterase